MHKELALCVEAKVLELEQARHGMTKWNHKEHKRRWSAFRDFLKNAAADSAPPNENQSTTWPSNIGASLTSPDS
ncbi:MAG: hypothetical protein ACKPKO_62130, partial [Candidatus Fonsibacter sp.]